jgi:lipopolysaccharide export LptBFGC system permease protein LptF
LNEDRRTAILGIMNGFYFSAHRRPPTGPEMDDIIEQALRDWQDIPTGKLIKATNAAREQAKTFIPTNMEVLKAWRQMAAHDNDFLTEQSKNQELTYRPSNQEVGDVMEKYPAFSYLFHTELSSYPNQEWRKAFEAEMQKQLSRPKGEFGNVN